MTSVAENSRGPDAVIWQHGDQGGDVVIGEPAIALKAYDDVMEIRQDDQEILVNYSSIPQLRRLLLKLEREQRNRSE